MLENVKIVEQRNNFVSKKKKKKKKRGIMTANLDSIEVLKVTLHTMAKIGSTLLWFKTTIWIVFSFSYWCCFPVVDIISNSFNNKFEYLPK